MVEESTWQSAFVVVTVSLGDSVDDARAALTADDWAVAGPTASALLHTDRGVRARALAGGLTTLGLELEALRLA